MLKLIVLFVVAVAGCHAGTVPDGQGVFCGEMPNNIFSCMGSPVVNPAPGAKCNGLNTECERIKCVFREAGWLDGDKIIKKKVAEFFDQYVKEHAEWSPAVDHLKAACVGDRDVPAQGVDTNCPTFDVMHCVLTSFIKYATPGQWKNTADCKKTRSYAAACPVCPDSCFARQVPIGACNACLTLPRSA